MVFDDFADVEVTACDVLGALVVFRIVGEIAGTAVLSQWRFMGV